MKQYNNLAEQILADFRDALTNCPQSETYHGEGSVYRHTVMVLDALHGFKEYKVLDQRRKCILDVAAVMHDIGKISTTVFENGGLHSPRHSSVGCNMARRYLWEKVGLDGTEEDACFREAVCLLIKHHSIPPNIETNKDSVFTLNKIASYGLQVPEFTVGMLCLLAKADALGRICKDKEQLLESVEFCEMLADDEGCLDDCYQFSSSNARRKYLNKECAWVGQELYDDRWGEVILMSGLPGVGKDTWISKNIPDMHMISLDNIRRKMKISPKDKQGEVVNAAKEQAREYMRKRIPFVWNATNITPHIRGGLVNLFESYGAKVRIVYLESKWEDILSKNRSRGEAVPETVIRQMLGKTTPPYAYEADNVVWHFV